MGYNAFSIQSYKVDSIDTGNVLRAERKYEIIFQGYRYIVKFQKSFEVGLPFNYMSKYQESHISS